MDLEKIRKLNDKELSLYLRSLTTKKGACTGCGAPRPNYIIYVHSKEKTQQKKLCLMCHDCYGKFLDYIGVSDIDWD